MPYKQAFLLYFNNPLSVLHVAYFSFTVCAQSLEF